MTEGKTKGGFSNNPLFTTKVKSANIKLKEILFGYFLGPFGALLSSGIFGGILNKYFNDVLFAGGRTDAINTFLFLMPLISVVLVVSGNLIIGQLIERTKSRHGKARPWILLSAFLISVASVLMFIVPFENEVGKMIWLTIGYNLFYAVAYPIYFTANSVLVPVSTRNMKQRGLLASANNISTLAVMGAGTMVFPFIADNLLKKSIPNWFVAMLAVAIFGLLACVLQYYFTRERVTEEEIKSPVVKEKTPVSKQLKAVATDKTWWFIILCWLFVQIGGLMQNVSMPFFSEWVVKGVGGWGLTMTILGIVGAIPMAIAVVIVWPLSNKFGKKNLAVIGLFIGSAGGILAGLVPSSLIVVSIGMALQCLGAAPICYLILAMLADELDHLEAKNGFRCDGLTMSVYSIIGVILVGVSASVLNGLLGANGYVPQPDGVAEQIVQSEAAKNVMTIGYIWFRTIGFAIAGILLIFFTVEKNLKQEQIEILEKQKAEVLARGEVWIEPAERLRIEQEQYDREAEEARIAESKEYCAKKGLNFEEREAAYQAKLAQKNAAKKPDKDE